MEVQRGFPVASVLFSFLVVWSTFSSPSYVMAIKGDCQRPNRVRDNSGRGTLQEKMAKGVSAIRANRLEVGANVNGIFFLGLPGSGKSTVTQILGEDPAKVKVTKADDGSFIFFDDAAKINRPKGDPSRTLLPDFVAIPGSGVILVDCPAFEGKYGTEKEILAMYHLKHALGLVNQAKFIFTVTNAVVQSLATDLTQFDALVTHAVNLIPSPKGLESAIGMIVTKIKGTKSKDEVLKDVKANLEKYVTVQKAELANGDANLIQRKIDFVEALLSNPGSDGLPTKIGYLLDPEDCGTLADLPGVATTKTLLTELFSTRLAYAFVSPADFQIVFNDKVVKAITREHIPDTVDLIHRQAEQGATSAVKAFMKKFNEELEVQKEVNGGMQNPSQYFTEVMEQIKSRIDLLRQNGTDFGRHLFDIFGILQMNPGEKTCITNEVRQLDAQLIFFESVSGYNIPRPEISWMSPLEKAMVEVTELQQFYHYCETVERDLNKYPHQLKLDELGRNGNADFFQDEALDVLNAFISVPQKISDLWEDKLSRDDKEYLADLIKAQIPNVQMTCEKSTLDGSKKRLKVVGKNVKMSDIVKGSGRGVLDPLDWPSGCTESSIQQLSILAQNNIFFDANLQFICQGVHVSIVAGNWEVIARTKLELQCNSLPSGASPGQAGVDGGTFIGMRLTEKNIGSLEINTCGGPGADGENGAKGDNGKKGEDAKEADFGSAKKCKRSNSCGSSKSGRVTNGKGDIKQDIQWFVHTYFYVLGSPGSRGGNGGQGGQGGTAGKPGTIEIVVAGTGGGGEPKLVANPGAPGKGGSGGPGGKGAVGGNHMSCKRKDHIFKVAFWERCLVTKSSLRTGEGKRGKTGANGNTPSDKVPLGFDPNFLITEFKGDFIDQKTSAFMDAIDTFVELLKYQNPLTFAQELLKRETEYYQDRGNSRRDLAKWERKQEGYVKFYQRFLEKVKRYAKALGSELTQEGKIALNYIYATALSKSVALRQDLMSAEKVINTKGYFRAVEQRLDRLREAQIAKSIAEERDIYKEKLDAKIAEATHYIETELVPIIDRSEEWLEQATKALVEEVEMWLKKAEHNEQELRALKKKMERQFPLRLLFGGMRIASVAVGFLGPLGGLASTVLREVAGLGSEFLLDKTDPRNHRFELPAAFYEQMAIHSRKYYENKIETVESMIDLVLAICDKFGIELEDVIDKVGVVQRLLGSFRNIYESWKGLPDDIFPAELQLNAGLASLGTAVNTASKVSKQELVKYMDAAFAIVSEGLNVFKDILNALNDIKIVKKLIEDAQIKVAAVKGKKDEIFSDFVHFVADVYGDIKNASNSLDGKTLVGISIKKWDIQRRLKMMLDNLQAFTRELAAEQQFTMVIETVDKAFNMLIEMYQHIERYEEKKELADYIANIHTLPNAIDKIKNPQMKKTIKDLEFLMQANLFLNDYQLAISAFKQWCFPFASTYLISERDELEVPELLKMDKKNALDEVLDVYRRKVGTLSTQIQEYESVTVDGDGLLITSMFRGGLVSTRPFFVWKNREFNQEIVSLLSGQTVELKADMMNDPATLEWFRGMTAVKYKCIRIKLRANSTSPKVQEDLDELLKYFHMRMTHSGISEYRALGNRYVMFDSNQTYRYSFEEVGGEAVSWNQVKKKICKNGDFLMSPFTWWTLTILPANPSVSQSKFDELANNFGNVVNLELEGDGMYLDEVYASPWQLKDLQLESFYQPSNDSSLALYGRADGASCKKDRSSMSADTFSAASLDCLVGVDFECFNKLETREKDCDERQWFAKWKYSTGDNRTCYCCQRWTNLVDHTVVLEDDNGQT